MSRHWYFFVLPTLVDVATLEIRCHDIEVNFMTLSTRCRDISPLSFNLSCFDMMSRHCCCHIATLQVKNFNAYAFFDVELRCHDGCLILLDCCVCVLMLR